MSVLVTGASGHLGAHLARLLRNDGQPVRALVRATSDLRGLEGLDLELARGDITDAGTLRAAVEGCGTVYHLAAPTDRHEGTGRIIVEGTRNVLEACRNAGVRRLVYTSSIVTVGYSADSRVVLDEQTHQRTDATVYHSAKWLAERDVLAFAERASLDVVVVNPATIVGPLDYRVTPSNAPIQQCLDYGLRWAVPGGVTVVHVEDVARGHMLAMERGRPGERYILGGDRVTFRDYFERIARESGRPGPLLTLPRPAVWIAGAIFNAVERLTGRDMPFTFAQAWQLSGKYGWYSSDKAARELGYEWRPAGDAIRDYITWVRRGRPASV